jgi:two-component sensor histidine kinase
MPELRTRLRDIKADHAGRIWLANDFGLFMFTISKSKFNRIFYQDPKKFADNSYRGIVATTQSIYACNEFAGLSQAKLSSPDSVKVFKVPNTGFYGLTQLHADMLLGINNVYIFTFDSRNMKLAYKELPADLGKKYFWKICDVGHDSFLLGSSYGLRWLDAAKMSFAPFTQLNGYNELHEAVVIDIVPKGNRKYWLCTYSGLYDYDIAKGITARYSQNDTGANYIPAKEIQHCAIDADGTMWLATTKGLLKWNRKEGRYKLFAKQDGLSNENICAVYSDSQNRLWLSSDYGIMSFDKTSLAVHTYLTNSGITHNEFNRISHFKDSAGNIYFGSLNGITVFNPNDFSGKDEGKRATLAVTSFQQFNGKTNSLEDKTGVLLTTKEIVLNPADLFFTINFSLLNFNDVEQNTYYWKIDGVDTGWNGMKDHVLRLSRLPYGNRILRIKAQSGDGSWGSNELQFSLTVIKPLYLQTWFLVLCATVIALSVGFLYRRRVFRLKKENIKLDKIVKEKTAGLEVTIQDLKESFEQKDILMKEIHHRVKNNLQVISVLLKLQLSNVVDDNARKSIEESMSRVSSIALIHQYLYKNEDLTSINISTYASELCQQIGEVYRIPSEKIKFSNDIPDMLLDIDTAVPIGVILNELMVNSNKYAFSDRNSGAINIKLEKNSNHYALIYSDDGPGLPNDYNMHSANSLGMTIVKSLATQLKGAVLYDHAKNEFFITFKDTPMRKNIA